MRVLVFAGRFRPTKRVGELAYWLSRAILERGRLGNTWYRTYFTTVFDLDESYYEGKRMLDIGCGPRGSLEWATMAVERVGADPLVRSYRLLHKPRSMKLVAARAESLPFPDDTFDVVSCFNALDHVEDVAQAIAELTRVAKPGGTLLLIVDVEHEATHTEPHRLEWSLIDDLKGWKAVDVRRYRRFATHWESLQRHEPYEGGVGILVARLERLAAV